MIYTVSSPQGVSHEDTLDPITAACLHRIRKGCSVGDTLSVQLETMFHVEQLTVQVVNNGLRGVLQITTLKEPHVLL
jgi:hypothetical protein